MSEQTETKPGALPTGIYIKGNEARSADTPARAVQLAFDGYVHKDSLPKAEAPAEESDDSKVQVDETAPAEPVVAEPDAETTKVAAKPTPPKDQK